MPVRLQTRKAMTNLSNTSLAAPYCGVMEMPKQWCAHCRKLPDPVPLDDLAPESSAPDKGPWITAKFSGNCFTCKDPFEIGAAIRNNGRGQWEANCCD